MATELAQTHLRSGTTVRTCWIEPLKVGDEVTLKNSEDPARWWKVVRVEPERRTAAGINRGWNNNI
jgi:hypothetical protein